MATDFLSENGEANVQNTSRQNFEDKEKNRMMKLWNCINSGQSNDNEDEEEDHDSEVLISVKVASTDDDILVQYEELTSDEMFPHEDGERYT